jgi:hypothetical protein
MGILGNTKAILGYHYPTGKWNVIALMYGSLSVGADVYERCQIDKMCFTYFVEAPIKSIDNDGVNIDDGFELPQVLTLEQSIINTKKELQKHLK